MPKKGAQSQKKKVKKPRGKKKETTDVTLFHLRTYFFIFFFAGLLLFYPGRSFYAELFSFHKDAFSQQSETVTQYEIKALPYVVSTAQDPIVSARGAYVIDLETATPLFSRNQHSRLFPASVTKVITALTAMDIFELEQVLEVKRVIEEGQSMGLVKGERLTFENLLYGMLVHSGNDAAYVIADNHPKGYEAFINAMNAKAERLGMKNTQFQNPAGLDSYSQYTTAFDLSLAARELLKNKELSKIVSTKSITVSDVDFVYFHPLNNVNKLLGEIPGVAGLKTGKTDLAGENLITLYKRNGNEFLIVLLGSQDRFTDTQALVKWIDENVQYAVTN